MTEQAAWAVINEVVLDVNLAELTRRLVARTTVNVPLRSCTAHSLCEEEAPG